ncbi:helix-turn-helix transcriptional regulator [Undibacterium sp.]|uniref:helix-turn-helix domain-containing protein n=1 Tax=Undibacterium sp. TaxID=1914977 RepID=UPI0025EAA9E4|nr:helix-turn-helix transcriptional regulator [Undibacterium sp.]
MKSVKYLEKLQSMKKINDTDLAKILGISQPSISNIKAERRIMEDETCLAIALALDINPMEIIGAACIDRAEKTGQKSLWEVFTMRTAQGISAVLILMASVTLFLTPSTGEARPAYVSEAHTLYYVKFKK